jgi:hypothetical protein
VSLSVRSLSRFGREPGEVQALPFDLGPPFRGGTVLASAELNPAADGKRQRLTLPELRSAVALSYALP